MMPPGGLDPEMMKVAMEQMRNMTPEQMQQMKEQVSNMSPEAMQNAMNMMKNTNPEDMRRQMRNTQMPTDPNVLKEQMSAFEQQSKAQSNYKYNASLTLKQEGNSFFVAGKYGEASEKYTRAVENLKGLSTDPAKALLKTCYLNNAACCLHLKQYEVCITQCSEVMKTETSNLKAFYRRGQAYFHTNKHEEAVKDLKRALEISPQDEGVGDALKKAEDALAEYERTKPVVEDLPAEAEVTTEEPKVVEVEEVEKKKEEPKVEEVEIEEVNAVPEIVEEEIVAKAVETKPSVPTSSMNQREEQMKQMLNKNPDMLKDMSKKMKQMSDDDLKMMGKMSGLPEGMMNADMMRMASDAMANMNAEDMKRMMDMQKNMPESMRTMGSMPSTSQGAAPGGPGGMGRPDPAQMEQMSKMMKENPDMLKQASEMMSNMSEEDLKTMAKMSGMPEDSMKPEMMKAAADAMSKMKPDDLVSFSPPGPPFFPFAFHFFLFLPHLNFFSFLLSCLFLLHFIHSFVLPGSAGENYEACAARWRRGLFESGEDSKSHRSFVADVTRDRHGRIQGNGVRDE